MATNYFRVSEKFDSESINLKTMRYAHLTLFLAYIEMYVKIFDIKLIKLSNKLLNI